MAEKASISITYTPTAESTSNHSLRITLETEYSSEKENNADLADIDSMLAMAMSGLSSLNTIHKVNGGHRTTRWVVVPLCSCYVFSICHA